MGLVTGFIPPPKDAFADSSKIVSLYYDGQKKVVTTNAPTVAAALSEAGVEMAAGDLVEPSPTTQISDGFFNINVYRSRPVVVVDGVNRKVVQTALQSSRLIAEQAGLKVYPEDTYETAVIDDIAGLGNVGQVITINRAVPVVLLADGHEQTVRTQQKTVGGLLHERDVAFGPKDTVSVDREAEIQPKMVIQVNRVKVVVVKQTETIGHEVTTIKDPNLESGTVAVKTPGKPGQKEVTYRVHYQNGSEQVREVLAQTVIEQPVTEVKVYGTKAKSGPTPENWLRLRLCESGNNYANKHNSLYRGAYQFSYGTWGSVGGSGDPADASPAEQDMRAQLLYSRRGASPWPVCGRFLR